MFSSQCLRLKTLYVGVQDPFDENQAFIDITIALVMFLTLGDTWDYEQLMRVFIP